MSKPQLLRSNKYQTMSDDKIISLYMKNLGSEEKHFLDIEVDIRQLKTEADSRLSETKRSKRTRKQRPGRTRKGIRDEHASLLDIHQTVASFSTDG